MLFYDNVFTIILVVTFICCINYIYNPIACLVGDRDCLMYLNLLEISKCQISDNLVYPTTHQDKINKVTYYEF